MRCLLVGLKILYIVYDFRWPGYPFQPLRTTLKLPQLPNLSLLMLPAGSPESNPAGQLWQQLRDRSLANRCQDWRRYALPGLSWRHAGYRYAETTKVWLGAKPGKDSGAPRATIVVQAPA